MESVRGRDAAERLRDQRERIVDEYVRRARAEVGPARDLDLVALADSTPLLLSDLADVLEGDQHLHAIRHHQRTLGRTHGELRALQAGYDLDLVLREYALLERVLFDVLEEQGPLGGEERGRIDAVLRAAMRGALAEFLFHAADSRRQLAAASEEIEHQKRRYDAMLGATDDLVFVVDHRLRLAFLNAAITRFAARPLAELIGCPIGELRIPKDAIVRVTEGVRRALSGERVTLEVELPSYTGLRRYECKLAPMPAVDGSPAEVVGTAHDVHERARLIAELEEERAMRERFVYSLTHDLRAPLAAARASAQLACRNLRHSERLAPLLGRVLGALDRASDMVDDLLTAARLHAGKPLALPRAPTDLRALAEHVVDEARLVHGDRFALRLEGILRGEWNRDGLRRVLENLLSNAVKYGDDGPPIIVAAHRASGHVLLSVHNDGPPIPPDELPQVFSAFRRTSDAQRSGQAGWGIGLALVRGIVEAHGGRVWAESAPGAGTTFFVELPG